MALSMCQEHQCVDEPDNPCLLCVIRSIRDWTVSKDGSVESAEEALEEIQGICDRALDIDPEEETVEETDEELE